MSSLEETVVGAMRDCFMCDQVEFRAGLVKGFYLATIRVTPEVATQIEDFLCAQLDRCRTTKYNLPPIDGHQIPDQMEARNEEGITLFCAMMPHDKFATYTATCHPGPAPYYVRARGFTEAVVSKLKTMFTHVPRPLPTHKQTYACGDYATLTTSITGNARYAWLVLNSGTKVDWPKLVECAQSTVVMDLLGARPSLPHKLLRDDNRVQVTCYRLRTHYVAYQFVAHKSTDLVSPILARLKAEQFPDFELVK